MEKAVFKQVNNIKSEDVIKEMTLKDIPDYGDIISIKKFEDYNHSGCIIDSDGSGYLIYNNKEVINSRVWCFNKSVLIGSKYILPYESLIELLGDKVSIIWFNK